VTKLTTLFCAAALAFSASAAHAGVSPLLSGFNQTYVAAVDDGSTKVNLANGLMFGLNGGTYSSLYVNTNGNVSFGNSLTSYAPGAFNGDSFNLSFLAPFFGDVDIRDGHGTVGYGYTLFEGHKAMAVTWDSVGYFNLKNDKKNTFQLVLVDRSDTGANNFDFYYNYGSIQWDQSTQSDKAHAGFHLQGAAADFEFDGSGNPGKSIDSGKFALVKGSNVGLDGRYAFNVRGGVAAYGLEQLTPAQSVPLPGSLPLVGIGAIALAYSRRRKA